MATPTTSPAVNNLGSIARSTGTASGSSAARSPAQPIKEDMDRQAFLTLFTTQLQNQNPLDPVKNEAFVAQLAQFSQLEATTRMASSMETLSTSLQAERLMGGAALIGRKVASPQGTAELQAGGSIQGVINVPDGASSVRLDVYDTSGQKVFTQSLGRQAPGEVSLRWDGRDSTGKAMPPGRYKAIATVDSFGKVSQVPLSSPSVVKSVSFSPSANGLVLELEDGSTVPLSDVRRIDG
jgi:flagellar basal-body rod modification protein FlgD